jgi:hypothetical protein
MIVEIGAEAAQFPEKEYINGIVFAVYPALPVHWSSPVPLNAAPPLSAAFLKSFCLLKSGITFTLS